MKLLGGLAKSAGVMKKHAPRATAAPTEDHPEPEDLLRYRPLVRRVCRELTGNFHEAEEVEQLTWLRVICNPPRHGGSIPAWLIRIARNVMLSRIGAEQSRRERESAPRADAYPKTPPQIVAEEQRNRAIERALSELDTKKREVLSLRYLEGRPPRQIAHMAGVPVGTVRSRIKRGLAALRDVESLRHHLGTTNVEPCCLQFAVAERRA